MGSAGAPEADVPRGPARREDRQGLLRVRRDREEEVVDDLALDTKKAAGWAALAGLANAAALIIGDPWFWPLIAAGYGLLLPALAVLQVRHATVRSSGAILGTASGMATVTVGIAASANPLLVIPALFVRGIWWWTIGKMWWETGVLPPALGLPTMVFAVIALLSIALPVVQMDAALAWSIGQTMLALFSLGLALALWRSR